MTAEADGSALEMTDLLPPCRRSTTAAAKDIFAAAAAAADEKVAESVRREKNWRFGYTRHVVQNLKLCARSQVQPEGYGEGEGERERERERVRGSLCVRGMLVELCARSQVQPAA